jgi:hypothetical protein
MAVLVVLPLGLRSVTAAGTSLALLLAMLPPVLPASSSGAGVLVVRPLGVSGVFAAGISPSLHPRSGLGPRHGQDALLLLPHHVRLERSRVLPNKLAAWSQLLEVCIQWHLALKLRVLLQQPALTGGRQGPPHVVTRPPASFLGPVPPVLACRLLLVEEWQGSDRTGNQGGDAAWERGPL